MTNPCFGQTLAMDKHFQGADTFYGQTNDRDKGLSRDRHLLSTNTCYRQTPVMNKDLLRTNPFKGRHFQRTLAKDQNILGSTT